VSSPSLAADFFLIAHDPFDDGRLRMRTEHLGCGLVGAKLADLMLNRRLGVDGDDLVVLEPTGRPDEVDDYVIDAVQSQDASHPVRTWVEPLQDGLYALIARGLVTSGMLRRQQGVRRIGRGRQADRFPANDLLAACRPQQEVEDLLQTPKELTLRVGVLAALIGILGLDGLLNLQIDRASMREILTEVELHLPGDLQAVCDGVRAVTAEVSLRAR
jgi:hypothetical protein